MRALALSTAVAALLLAGSARAEEASAVSYEFRVSGMTCALVRRPSRRNSGASKACATSRSTPRRIGYSWSPIAHGPSA